MRLFNMLTRADIKRLNDSTIEELKERLKELEGKCREAGRAMIELNLKYETNIKELDRLTEENTSLKTMMKGDNGKNRDNAS